jgi:hypothetical protein
LSPLVEALDELLLAGVLAAVLAGADEAAADEVVAAGAGVLDELEHADTATAAATGSARASHVARLDFILNPFNRRRAMKKVGGLELLA